MAVHVDCDRIGVIRNGGLKNRRKKYRGNNISGNNISEGDAILIACWVSCVIQPEKFEIFSVRGGRQISPPPSPKIFAGAYVRVLI